MQKNTVNGRLFHYIEESPCAFFTVATVRKELEIHGFHELKERERWKLKPGDQYYVVRNASSILSFVLPESAEIGSFHVIASHSDSPTFRIKPGPAIPAEGGLLKLNVEKYGGTIDTSWFDRPLSVAGRIMVDEGDRIQQRLVWLDRDLLMIPSLAIHMSRDLPEKKVINVQTDMQPVITAGKDPDVLWKLISEDLKISRDQIIGADLSLCSRERPTLWGAEQEFIASPRLDDLECCFCSLMGFLESSSQRDVIVHCVFDNEEVGSRTRQGADSGFLRDTLERICLCMGMDREGTLTAAAGSFLVSADNAHACHPNYPQMADPVNRPSLNRGIVLKHQAEQRYATDAVSAAIFRKICAENNIPFQEYTNRSDQRGGSTLGNISVSQLALNTVDIGLPQLAMHSICETAGADDPEYLVRFAKAFYSEKLPGTD